MGKIKVENIRLYAHHGCLKEESVIGSEYRVDIVIDANLDEASVSDELGHTVDYVHINRLVKEEMKINSKLLEHVGRRMLDRLFVELPMITKARVSISKLNPPINGDVEKVTVSLKEKRTG